MTRLVPNYWLATTLTTALMPSVAQAIENSHDIDLYASVRPTLAYLDRPSPTDEDDSSTVDLQDALSRIGVKSSIDLGEGLRAIFHGEWTIDVANDGSFGKSRHAYAGLHWDGHQVTLGKTRPPHYLLVAEHLDIFNHANSPFAYDQSGPFFVDNMLSYHFKTGAFQFQAAAKFDGDTGSDKDDLFNAGASYQLGSVYVAAAFLQTTSPSVLNTNAQGDENTSIALAMTTTLDKLYLAAAYQDLDTDIDRAISKESFSGETFDITSAYSFDNGYTTKIGYFYHDDGRSSIDSKDYDGVNLTLERQINDAFRVHVEYLHRDFKEQDDFSSLTIGMRYDINFKW